MNNKQLLLVVKAVSAEKDVQESTVIKAIEMALAGAAKKRHHKALAEAVRKQQSDEEMEIRPEEIGVRVTIDRNTGAYSTCQYWEIVADPTADEELEFPERQIPLSQAQQNNAKLAVGDVIEEPLPSVEFGRITAQAAKQVIMQELRKAKCRRVAEIYTTQVGKMFSGVVKRVTRDGMMLDIGDGVEAFLRREDTIARENMRVSDRVRVVLTEVRTEGRGPQLLVSRTDKHLLIELFKIEVPEIGEEVIEIKAAARDPGSRAKLAVKTNDGRIDPIGACIGMRGARVQAVSNELNGERVDIVLWDDNPAQLVINSMAPAEVASIVVDEDSNTMDIAVTEEQLSQAIGRSGQNIRLASELSGWTLNVMSEKDAQAKTQAESQNILETFKAQLDLDEDVAALLVEEGFSTIEEIAYVPEHELLEIDDFDEDIVSELRKRAKDVLLTKAIADEAKNGNATPAEDLLALEDMTPELAGILAKHQIVTQEDLAECAVNDLLDIEELELTAEQAAKLIMAARAPWFEDK